MILRNEKITVLFLLALAICISFSAKAYRGTRIRGEPIIIDAPWRIEPGFPYIPILIMVKDAPLPVYLEKVEVIHEGRVLERIPYNVEVPSGLRGKLLYLDSDWYDIIRLPISGVTVEGEPYELSGYVTLKVKLAIRLAPDIERELKVWIRTHPLPTLERDLGKWYPGDLHYHSSYTDNIIEFGAPVEATVEAGRAIGLRWNAITDHSFDLRDSKTEDVNHKWEALKTDVYVYSKPDYILIVGEEVSCYGHEVTAAIVPPRGGVVHFLVLGMETFANFIPGQFDEDGIDVGGWTWELEDVIRWVNQQQKGAVMYAAHPEEDPGPGWFLGRVTWSEGDYNLLGYHGLQVWNGRRSQNENWRTYRDEALEEWKRLLFKGRKVFIAAGSDAHGDFNRDWAGDTDNAFGRVRTYVCIEKLSREEILKALRNGHVIITDGPVVALEAVNEFGEKSIIGGELHGLHITLKVLWKTTPEFGRLDEIRVLYGIPGEIQQDVLAVFKRDELIGYEGQKEISADTIAKVIQKGKRAYIWVEGIAEMVIDAWGQVTRHEVLTNPIWIARKETVASVQKALRWFRETQSANGSWQDSVGITALAVLAFLNEGYDESDTVVRKAIQYILSRRNPDGSFGANRTYETSVAIWALVATHNPTYKEVIAAAKDWLITAQYDEGEGATPDNPCYGGWRYGASPADGDLSNTQFALMALDAAYAELGLKKPSPDDKSGWVYKAIKFVSRCQNRPASNDQPWAHDPARPSYNDGGFIYHPGGSSLAGGTKSYGSMTAAGIWSLRLCGVPEGDPRIQAALSWLRNNEDCAFDDNPGHPYGQSHCFLYYYYMTIAKALLMCPNTGKLHCSDWYKSLATALASKQKEDGRWENVFAWHGWEHIPELATAYALLALQVKKPLPPQKLWMSLILASNADLHVYDPLGRHIGMNYTLGRIENEIPGATFEIDAQGRQVITLTELIPGDYRIELVGTGTGDYSLTIQGYEDTEEVLSSTFSGSIKPGETWVASALVSSIIGELTVYVEEPVPVPTGLVAIPGNTIVDLRWNPYVVPGFDLVGYNVYRSETRGTGYERINAEVVVGTSYRDSGLTNGVTYYYVITAVDRLGRETKYSTEVSATPRAGIGLFYDMEYASQGEAETAGWTFTGLWRLISEDRARRFSPRPTPFPSPTRAAYFGTENGNYVTLGTLGTEVPPDRPELRLMQAGGRRSYGELTSPAIPVSGISSVELSFQYFRVVEHYPKGSYDKTYVQVSFDGGSWETVWSLDSTTPSEPVWKIAGPIVISVPTGASSMRMRFVFDSVDHFYNNYLGWLIDNIRIMSVQPGVTRFTYSNLTVAPTAGPVPLRIAASATVTNIGTTRGTETVRFFVDGVERATRAITLDPGATTTVSFDYTFTEPGSYSVTIDGLPPVAVRAGLTLFYEGFETGAAGWEFTSLWHVTSGGACFQCEKLSGSYAYYAQGCNYDIRARTQGTLASPVIDLQGAQFVQIRFDHFRHVEQYAGGDFDRTRLEVSFDGTSWTTVWMRSSKHPSPECGTVTIGPFAVPSGATSMRLRFVFDSVDKYYNNFPGWAVDNVTVAPASSGQPLAALAIEPAAPRSLAELISVFNVPNPVRDVHTTTFVVRGVEAEEIRVEVYDLTGRLVWRGEGLGNELSWGTQDLTGLPLANGVYLWRVWVKVGEEWVVSAIQKLVILR